MGKTRVVIADDHPILREGIRALLRQADDIEVVGEAADGREAIEVCARLDPDVVLMDIAMPGLGGLEATGTILRSNPRTRVLVLTQYEDREYIRQFLKLGVAGYVLKKTAGTELASAIRSAHRGGLVLDPDVARIALKDTEPDSTLELRDDPYAALTEREKQVLKLVAEGHSNKEVAGILGISVKTAMSHREHLMEKLDVHSRTELVKFALRRGIVRMEA
jgi:DNA-binding NarL/FixJ family response regulator